MFWQMNHQLNYEYKSLLSKHDGGSRQSSNAVTAWQDPLHHYSGGRKEQKRISFYIRGLTVVRQNLRFKISLNSSFVSK